VSESFYASVARIHARVALSRGDVPRARALNALDQTYAGASASTHLTDAWIALAVGDLASARAAFERARAMAPEDDEMRDLAARLGIAPRP
jgi:hypothetical protein